MNIAPRDKFHRYKIRSPILGFKVQEVNPDFFFASIALNKMFGVSDISSENRVAKSFPRISASSYFVRLKNSSLRWTIWPRRLTTTEATGNSSNKLVIVARRGNFLDIEAEEYTIGLKSRTLSRLFHQHNYAFGACVS